MKQRIYFFLVMLVASVVQMRAQQMAVALNDGSEVMFEEGYTSCKLTFSNGQMLVHVDGTVKNTIGVKDINRIYFYTIDSSVDKVQYENGAVYSALTEELVINAQPGTVVTICQMNGAQVLYHIHTIAATPVSVALLPEGVYVAVVGGETLKFVKR